ncbi:glycoside hydrolase family 2 TIM barrel-domain containing protein [Dorea sp.]|uniref:glycoside hydrolase family 2 TIM barrel-domain containing protein n=1 Tax=Dorea sp. TaxID=2040332 RepID=UPI003FD7ED58
MKKIDFNQAWTFCRVGEETVKCEVMIPHDAMISEKRTEDSAGGINTGWFEGYDYIYEKEFEIPDEYEKQEISFEFEGVYHNAEVYLNGEKAAYRPYGYTNFYIDADPYLKYGEKNQIRVIAHNADQPNSRWYSGAGIYRPVWMYVRPKQHILRNEIRVRTLSVDPAVIEAEVNTNAPGKVKLEVVADASSDVIIAAEIHTDGKLTKQFEIPDAKLWSVNTPNLYRLRVTFAAEQENGQNKCMETDQEEVIFGIRTLKWDKEKGITINGERVILRGACIHHDNGVLGACCYPDAEARKIRILKENGYNAIRSAHNPCSKALLEACDRQGMLVMDEFVDVWYIHKTEYDYVNYFKEWWKQDLKDMVEKDFNHPSVILYSIGNEVSETAQKKGIHLTKTMTEYLHRLDDSRPVSCGINIFFNFLSSIGFGVYSDKKAKKEAEQAEKTKGKKKKKAVGSQFFNDLAGLMGSGFMKTGATFYGCDVKTRGTFANMDIAGYNYGIKRYQHDLKKYPERLILGSETFCDDAYTFWEMAKKNPRIVGDFVWAGMDYLGEVGVGSWEYRDYAPEFNHGPGWITAGSGRIDLTGKPLAEAGYTKTAFELTNRPVIAVRPVNHTGEKHSPSAWKMTNAIESWSWEGCEGKVTEVEVYARAARVDLFLNGKKVGSNTLKNSCDTRFKVEYQPGMLETVVYNQKGKEISRNTLYTAGKETELRAIAEEQSVQKDHLAFIRLQYTDKNGTVKPLKRGILKVSVKGGKLLGLGNACPYNEIGYCTNETDTYWGEALAVVQADGSGDVVLEVQEIDGEQLKGRTVVTLQ